MATPFYRLLTGQFVIVGYEPDGDSIRFIADNLDDLMLLKRSDRIRPSKRDGSVQLRMEGIDATELHYGSSQQPLGKEGRDALLAMMGFSEVQFKGGNSTVVSSAKPDSVPGAILSQMAEANGRPVSYLLLGADVPDAGAFVQVDTRLLHKTVNYRMMQSGLVYHTVYTSMPVEHMVQFRQAAASAREVAAAGSVWAQDSTSAFKLDDQSSIDRDGACILPKLFRRCTDYLKAVDKGFRGNLVEWILEVSTPPTTRPENDSLLLRTPGGQQVELKLTDLLSQRNDEVAFQADTLDIVFVEK